MGSQRNIAVAHREQGVGRCTLPSRLEGNGPVQQEVGAVAGRDGCNQAVDGDHLGGGQFYGTHQRRGFESRWMVFGRQSGRSYDGCVAEDYSGTEFPFVRMQGKPNAVGSDRQVLDDQVGRRPTVMGGQRRACSCAFEHDVGEGSRGQVEINGRCAGEVNVTDVQIHVVLANNPARSGHLAFHSGDGQPAADGVERQNRIAPCKACGVDARDASSDASEVQSLVDASFQNEVGQVKVDLLGPKRWAIAGRKGNVGQREQACGGVSVDAAVPAVLQMAVAKGEGRVASGFDHDQRVAGRASSKQAVCRNLTVPAYGDGRRGFDQLGVGQFNDGGGGITKVQTAPSCAKPCR